MRCKKRSILSLAAMLAFAQVSAANTVFVVELPEEQLEVHHHTRPFNGFTNALGGGGGLIWRLLDRGVEKKRENKDRRIGRRLLTAAGERHPADELAEVIRSHMAELGITPIEQLDLTVPLSKAGKKVFSPPDEVATSKMAIKMWRVANRFMDYRPLADMGIRYVVEFRPSAHLESSTPKSEVGFMGLRTEVNVIDLAKQQVQSQTSVNVGFSAAGASESVPLPPALWKGGAGEAREADDIAPIVVRNLEHLKASFVERFERAAAGFVTSVERSAKN